MEKQYDHKAWEEGIYKKWKDSGSFSPTDAKETFTIIMPPPNANDPLHIGHARFATIEDVLVRYARMNGKAALWLPGADHAGIETQFVFEKKLKAKGKTRFDYPRDEFYKMVWDYVHENTDTMTSQLERLGASCDWSRFRFTLDPKVVEIVYDTFKKLHNDGLVYRDHALVNYCTFCGTAFSNLEVDHKESVSKLYYVKYMFPDSDEYVSVATVRPEPIFADTHLAVNPKDKKRKDLIGKFVLNPLTGAKMAIIADKYVDPEFGTGVVKITPAHDPNDFAIAKRHDLPVIQAIGTDGKILENGGKYAGLYVNQARRAVVEDLAKKGLIEKIDENYHNTKGVCYRCKNPIEPLPLEQWFIKVKPLSDKVLEAIKKKDVEFAADKYRKISIHWLKNIEDWNISRQIVWGIQIPAWKCADCGEWTITDGKEPEKCKCGSKKLTRDTDTFDTWFSSGQWPYATLMTGKKDDFDRFYPTDVMETAYDILFFWVLRMLMFGIYKTGKVPFRHVVMHGLVRDSNGQKISKSKGNVIDPIEMADKYGADALRMGLIWGALVENDIALSEDNIRGQRNFANKLWNIARFYEMVSQEVDLSESIKSKEDLHIDDAWILEELDKAIVNISENIEKYKLSIAAESVYEFIWHKLADVYLEKIKDRKEDALPVLKHVLAESLKITHPFMPFVTEAIWEKIFSGDLLICSDWPKVKTQ